MIQLKGEKNMKKEIRAFIKSIAPVSVTFRTEGFFFDCTKNSVNIDLSEMIDEYGFMRHLRAVHKYSESDKFSFFLWSILHEIGHYFTIDKADEDDEYDERLALAVIDTEKAKKSIAIQNRYFNLESEWLATEWAIKFVKTHKKICREIDKILRG